MLERDVRAMARAQDRLAPHGTACATISGATFVRGLWHMSPEDRYDHQPVIAHANGLVAVADARLDNRADLLPCIGASVHADISDGELACRVFASKGERAFDLFRGDFAFAAWDGERRLLTLARDITGQRPLHYRIGEGWVAVSSMPHGILAIDNHLPRINRRQLARFVADIPRAGDETFFETIRRVEPGHIVRISGAGNSSQKYWLPTRTAGLPTQDKDYINSARAHLELAVGRRLRGLDPKVGAHLSGGLDSGGVAATAALQMRERGGSITAFTSAPMATFDGLVPRGRIADEAELASKVAESHANMEHVIVRAERTSALEIIERDSGMFGEPLGLPCNQVWWAAINDAAQLRGLNLMLTAEAGNHAFSSGGVGVLHDYVRTGRIDRAIREGLCLRREGLRWRGIAYAALAPWVPLWVWRAIQRHNWGAASTDEGVELLAPEARALLPADVRAAARSNRPRGDRVTWQVELLGAADPGAFRKGTLARWHLEERDPTTDRDLVEFWLSVPSDQLLRGGVTRRLTRLAVADRLPADIVNGPRGYQGADWYERISPQAVSRFINDLAAGGADSSVVDWSRLAGLIGQWPTQGWENGSVISRFRYGMLRALSAERFARAFETGEALSALRH